MPKLKDCPNPTCIQPGDHLAIAGHSELGHWVVCRACHVRGPQLRDCDGAAQAWNNLPRKEVSK